MGSVRRPSDSEMRQAVRGAFRGAPWYPNTRERWTYVVIIAAFLALAIWVRS